MNWSASDSNNISSSFNLLDPRIQQWIWELKWSELRDIQEHAIPAILDLDRHDVIISAATAAGKTEAAFFPILTYMLSNQKSRPVALYISPLKALINDQWDRLDLLCERLDIMVTPWHGDISTSRKQRFLKKPGGCVLITPESLESLLMNYGTQIKGLFSSLAFCVIDELHAYMGTERGKQLQSLLHRLEISLNRKIPRIGLSATLGDMNMAAEFLRPGASEGVDLITSTADGKEFKVLFLGYQIEAPDNPDSETEVESSAYAWAAQNLYSALRGSNNLIFPNSRRSVEIIADRLRNLCEASGVPNEFWPHHGSLSKEIREETEQALKKNDQPATAICTNTLELGIDIGSVKSVAQVGSPPSVASLRQRIGRSGRKKEDPIILRSFCMENQIGAHSPISDMLREQLVQSIAIIRLLLQGWCEPIQARGLHLSTLVQQLLSAIAQYGGLTALQAWQLLCVNGPFANLTQEDFVLFLRGLGEKEVISQDHTGLLLLGNLGEKLVNHYSFYASFQSDEEYRLICNGKSIGTLPISLAVVAGSYLIFAGHRWRVEDVNDQQKVITVIPDKGGKAPRFFGGGSRLHDKIREEMREVLHSDQPVFFLDHTAAELLKEARFYYRELTLDKNDFLTLGKNIAWFTWRGDNVQDTLGLMLTEKGIKAHNEGLFILIQNSDIEEVREILVNMAQEPLPSAEELAALVKNKQQEKWDFMLPESLLCKNYASLYLDVENAGQVLQKLALES